MLSSRRSVESQSTCSTISAPSIATTTTQPDGSYTFPPVPDGDYTVSVDETTVPAGMLSTTGNNPESITVAGAAGDRYRLWLCQPR